MSLLESKAFDNFVKERVIEILQKDEGYVKINEQISKIEANRFYELFFILGIDNNKLVL